MFARLSELLTAYSSEEPILLERRAAWRLRLRWRETFVPDVLTASGKRPTTRPWESLLDPRAHALWDLDAREAYREAAMSSSRAYLFFDVGHGGRVDEVSFLAHLTGKIPHDVARAFVEDGPEHVDMYVVEEQLSWTMVWPHERDRIPIFAFAAPTGDALS